MQCRVCGKEFDRSLCPNCGYDASLDRELFPTLCNDGKVLPSPGRPIERPPSEDPAPQPVPKEKSRWNRPFNLLLILVVVIAALILPRLLRADESTAAPTAVPTAAPTAESRGPANATHTETPTPTAKPLIITGVREVQKERESGYIEISWDGGLTPISVLVMHYFTEDHNEGIVCYRSDQWGETQQDGRGVISGIVPGQRYWIKLTDSQGSSAWYDYTAPMGPKPDVSVTLTGISLVTWPYPDSRWHSVSGVNAEMIEKTCNNSPMYDQDQDDFLIEAKLNIGNLSSQTELRFSWYLIMPNGDTIFCCSSYPETVEYNGGWTQCTGIFWDNIYNAYGCIPTGEYTYLFGIDNYIVGSKTFRL